MDCSGCGNQKAFRSVIWHSKEEDGSFLKHETCDICGDPGSAELHDVYWDGKPEINLADDPGTGKPRIFGSKNEKARYLRERGIVEAGDRHHGAFVSGLGQSAPRDEHAARKAIAQVKAMHPAQRREAILRIIKTAEKGRSQ